MVSLRDGEGRIKEAAQLFALARRGDACVARNPLPDGATGAAAAPSRPNCGIHDSLVRMEIAAHSRR